MRIPSTVWSAAARLAAASVAAAALVGAGGRALERARLGATDEVARVRAQAEITARFDAAARVLGERADRVSASRRLLLPARAGETAALRRLFQTVEAVRQPDDGEDGGITVLDPSGIPVAWSGRVSDLPRDRLDGPRALFVVLDSLGPRVVRIEPLTEGEGGAGVRLGTVALEQRVDDRARTPAAPGDPFLLPTSLVDVGVRTPTVPSDIASPWTFTIRAADGDVLLQAEVDPARIQATRMLWRRRTAAAALATCAVLFALCAGPFLLWRRRRRASEVLAGTLVVAAILTGARVLLWAALVPLAGPSSNAPAHLLPSALWLLAIVWLVLDLIERRRLSSPRPPLASSATRQVVLAGSFLLLGGVSALLLVGYLLMLRGVTAASPFNLLGYSLHPLELDRLGLVFGLVLLHAGFIWLAVAVLRLPVVWSRELRHMPTRAVWIGATIAGVAIAVTGAGRFVPALPVGALFVAAGAALVGRLVLGYPRGRLRRASQAARIGLLFLSLLLPAAALYPSMHAFVTESKERAIAREFAPQVARQRDDLKLVRLPHALDAIDATPSLADFVTSFTGDAAPTTDRAFIVWSRTELAAYRATSAVELYDANGRLVSRFALVLPEYGDTAQRATECDAWELYEEASPFGSTLRPVLRASRAICDGGRRVGAIVVRAMLDYRSLPLNDPDPAYARGAAPGAHAPAESGVGHDVEFALYGWSRAPIYAAGSSVWPLADDVFDRMVSSRDPLWAQVRRDQEWFRVYFFGDNLGIYALGYPVITPAGHLVNLGELVCLCAVLFAACAAGRLLFRRIVGTAPADGRAALRETRSKFYRKLFIGFVASAVIPVVVLALAARTYLANQFRAGLEDAAVKTATVAQRLVEDYAALQQSGADSIQTVDDQFLVLVRWAIDQDVNVYDRSQLHATSQRDLFASRRLPTRTPSRVYQSIVIDRLPTSIGVEDIAGTTYLLAAAPVRTRGREGIVAVPQPLRGQDIERQRDELDRQVLAVSVLFVVLGAAFGYWIAERIADPVSRLTRATRRIARGDLDARIASTASDELRGLVEDFNRMADDLKRQRADLERTQRLEAWADMARQVAHDIKNPLTPIQLSAEHARRVNLDRGAPLSPVLDECVDAILSQVRLLRQISAEFSSFASSPTPHPEMVAIPTLVDEVLAPYRAGLASARVAIESGHEPGLPPVYADKGLFARALTNIVENALHAMPGGGRLAVRTRLAAAGPAAGGPAAIEVEVADTGMGMDADALARLFEPYFSTKASGTGLGLTIAKRNVELSGGTIRVTSARGAGTTVTLSLPAMRPAEHLPT